MKVTYLCHSGFSVETESALLVFDYYKGRLPHRPDGKKLIFFVSHYHDDHYSTRIFDRADDPDTYYILDSGIRNYPENVNISFVSERKTYDFGYLTVKTLRSTDCGVAYLVKIDGNTIYHAGDLHLWLWDGASLFQKLAVRTAFEQELALIKDEKIDLAFLPLDPRQEENGTLGFDYAVRNLDIKRAVPMHFWGDPHYVRRFAESELAAPYKDKLLMLLTEGEIADAIY